MPRRAVNILRASGKSIPLSPEVNLDELADGLEATAPRLRSAAARVRADRDAAMIDTADVTAPTSRRRATVRPS